MPEEFWIFWAMDGNAHVHWEESGGFRELAGITKSQLDALAAESLIRCQIDYSTTHSSVGSFIREDRHEQNRRVSLTARAYEAVDTDFAASDISYVKQLTPLADTSGLDRELITRCLPILGAGPADPKLWDSAVRTAGVILEERLRSVGNIKDASVGRDLVNRVFGKAGTLAKHFTEESERDGYRDLFAGVVGAFRNPSAHRLIDPNPQEGGAYIVFVNLLLKHLGKFNEPGQTSREGFLAACSSDSAPFFAEVLDQAAHRELQVSFGGKGFSVRPPHRSPFFYCYPPGANGRPTSDIEINLAQACANDQALNTEMRVRLLEVEGTKASGNYTIRLPVSAKTLSEARELFHRALEFMERQRSSS